MGPLLLGGSATGSHDQVATPISHSSDERIEETPPTDYATSITNNDSTSYLTGSTGDMESASGGPCSEDERTSSVELGADSVASEGAAPSGESYVVSIKRETLPCRTNYSTLVCNEVPFHSMGDIVWAKAPSLPSWPGKIISYQDWKKDDLAPPPQDKVRALYFTIAMGNLYQVWIKWFGSDTVSLVDWSNVKGLDEGMEAHKMQKRKKNV